MWELKISFDGSYNQFVRCAKKAKVRILIFPLSWTYEKSGIFITNAGTILGEEKAKKKFIRECKIKLGKRIKEIEFNNDFFIATAIEHKEAKTLYNKKIIYTQPFLIEENGRESITINSFEKKYLEELIKTMEKFFDIKIHYLKKSKIKNISFKTNAPDLTDKQKQAISLAILEGYYLYPRKTSIKKMSKSSKIGFATFHAHLRKAEQKLMPFFFSQ